MTDEIIDLLKNSKLRTEISQVMAKIYSYTGTIHDNPTDDMEEVADEDLYDEAWWRSEIFGEAEGIQDAFQKYVFNKMQEPHRISLDEVCEIFFDMAKPEDFPCPDPDSEYANSVYTGFLNYMSNHVLSYRHSAPFPICTVFDKETPLSVGYSWDHQTAILKPGEEDQASNLNNSQGIYECILWSKAGVNLKLVGRGRIESAFREAFRLVTQVTGCMSKPACKELRVEFERILPSMWRSIKLLGKALDMPSVLLFPSIDESRLPIVSESALHTGKVFVQKYLDAYFSKPTKKDSIGRRIRNAVHLLIESDVQPNDAVGLALSVAAIEALLGQKGKDITERLADNVAALLEPEPNKRYVATEFVKKLYDKRSRALHGEKIEGEKDARLKARQLAAGVLISMIARRDFLKGMELEPETPQKLFALLREKRFEPGQPMGVWESNVRKLWRS